MIYFVIIFLLSVTVLIVLKMHLQKNRELKNIARQYNQLADRYREEVLSNLSQREEWLYSIQTIQSRFIFRLIEVLPDRERASFKRRLSDLSNRMEDTRAYGSQLNIEQCILENDLLLFRKELIEALKSARFL